MKSLIVTVLLSVRMEDISDPEKLRINPKMNRTVCFYGWMRGVPLKNKSTVHIPGISLCVILPYMPYILDTWLVVYFRSWEVHFYVLYL